MISRTTILLMIAILLLGGCSTTGSKTPDEPPVEPPPEEPPDTTCLKVQVLGCRGCEDSSGPIDGASVTATGIDDSGEVSQGVTDSTGEVCLAVKPASRVRLDVSYGSLHGNPLEVETPAGVLDPADCNSCPLVTATHLVDPALVNEPLEADSDTWCASDYWNGSAADDHGFGSAWLRDPTHLGFSPSGLTMTLNDRDEAGNPCVPSPGDNCHGASYASAEYKTTCFHGYGTYTARITPPPWSDTNANSGIVIGFFTYTDSVNGDGTVGENDTDGWDEVDVEILGRWPRAGDNDTADHACADTSLVVHTNYFAKSIGGHEEDYCLPYGTYTYSFTWSESSIEWTATDSGGVVRSLRTATRDPDASWPTQPGRVFMNFWANSSGDDWVGPFAYPGELQAVFTNVSAP